MTRVHVIGGGLAGLSAAVELAGRAFVTVHEAGPACGGRARSYFDRALGARVDNGNHLLLSANAAAFRYLGLIGAEKTLKGPGAPVFPWFDLEAGLGWTLRLSRGRVPFWALPGGARVPGMRVAELGALLTLLRATGDRTVAECLKPGMLAHRLLEPFAVSALNTSCDIGSAVLLANIVRESLAKGGMACRPWYPAEGLSESFVDPAVRHLELLGGEVRTGARLSSIEAADGRVTALSFGEERVALGPEDHVVFAAPAPVAASVLGPFWPELTVPDAFESIVNLHFRLDAKPVLRGMVARTGFVGVVGGVTEWAFVKGDVISVTVSAANRYTARENEELCATIWGEVRRALGPVVAGGLPETPPPSRLIREKRATFTATPEQDRRRPGGRTPFANLVLAGDWTQTGLPSTIEGAIRSGVTAARTSGLV
ncbi:hydroxysqualene dehydroxylase HpnE [Acidomonas methanolica]|uniref:Amine oxidase/FAD-dependent phytoene desaturase n=1 Tax=Acidomonas methanolica NBRC 104435 TaxID=1231351 RepID=A0A023D2S1_ACIMT|nr:hydroxysqualene dehydroxylase HpnE [Acidomonas methanolica]MBU2654176.1 hydroxysqualene dehydroxylase HpnE [Acidomonas methanolica]TCS30594.1 squalene-associated FAD-dependent desaturase [Acidomonas methanolica]GAJ28364.1 amine oxidase/FAD-dependent phytoene desaturase [Acidomonas methanolica NBRC 104435]GEK98848.1 amine oxidase [Acidomonas methanolica NBRC 104435]